jgi:hypothetical protein
MASSLDTNEETCNLGAEPGSALYLRIQTRAYELFQMRGEELGNELDDWLQAEIQINSEPAA